MRREKGRDVRGFSPCQELGIKIPIFKISILISLDYSLLSADAA
jgi:hypothetical protein